MLAVLTELCAARCAGFVMPEARDDVVRQLASAARRAGRQPLALDAADTARLLAAGVDFVPAARIDELVRVTLLLGQAKAADFSAFLAETYRSGDNDERCAVLRAVALAPGPEQLVRLAVDACRTHVQPIFEAIACENPFPARHFPEANFNQMALKAVLLGVPLARVIGIASRLGPELARMARDFADERRAAGRPVPEDLALLAPRSQP